MNAHLVPEPFLGERLQAADAVVAEMDPAPEVARIMERFGARYGLKGFKRTPPDRSVDPIMVDEINVTPPGGLGTHPAGPWLWCSECERPKFWRGIAITNPDGDLFFIGDQCARHFYGGERVHAAKSTWRAARDRRRAEERFELAQSTIRAALADARQALPDALLEPINEMRSVLQGLHFRAARLGSVLNATGGYIHLNEPFFDTAGELQVRKVNIGRLKGAGLFRPRGIERRLAAALDTAACGLLRTDPSKLTTFALNKAITQYVDAGKAFAGAWAEASAANRFFDADNLGRFASYMNNEQHETIVSVENGWRLVGGRKPIVAFNRPSLPKLQVDYDRLY